MLSLTVRHGSVASCWNMYPTVRGIPVTGVPATVTLPPLVGSRPEISDRVVDLPQPVGPTTATNSPCATSNVTSRIAVNEPPFADGKILVARSSRMAGVFWVIAADRSGDEEISARLRPLRGQLAYIPFCAFCSPRLCR